MSLLGAGGLVLGLSVLELLVGGGVRIDLVWRFFYVLFFVFFAVFIFVLCGG